MSSMPSAGGRWAVVELGHYSYFGVITFRLP